MRKNILFVLCMVLVVATLAAVMAACESSTVKVTFMDGDAVYKTMEVKVGETFDLPKATKDNYTFVNWYTDAELNNVYVADKLMSELTLYAKFIPNEMQVVISAKGGEVSPRTVTVTKGQAYTLPVPTREGYTFVGYSYYDENDQEQAFPTEGTYTLTKSVRVEANWEIAHYTVIFTDGTQALAQHTVDHGSTVYAPDAAKAGYNFAGWLDSEGEATGKTSFVITSNATFTASYTPKTFHITVEGISSANTSVEYGATYTLPANPALPEGAAEFLGYLFNGEEFAVSGTYTWTTDISVRALFLRDPMYNKSRVTVYAADTTTPAKQFVVDDGSTIAAELATVPTDKEGYNWVGWTANNQAFSVDTVINDDITIYAVYEPKSVAITVIRWDNTTDELTATYGQALVLPVPAARNGYRFLGYERTTGEEFTAPTVADYDSTITIREKWEQLDNPDKDDNAELFVAVKKDGVFQNYFKERNSLDEQFTYVFLTGASYDLSGIKAISGADGYIDINIEGEVAELNVLQNVGEFTMNITRDMDGTDYSYTRKVKVVKNVTMSYGKDDYTKVWVNNEQSSDANFQVARSSENVMAAGVENFVFDITIQTNLGGSTFETLPFAEANIDVDVTNNGTAVAANLYNVNTLTGAITFDNSLVGETVTVALTPRYAAEGNQRSFTLALNDGVNVYDNAQLKSRYSDLGVHQINILRNITAELVADDYMAGHGKQIGEVVLSGGTTLKDIDVGTPQNDYSHGVYTRITTDTGDTMRINGNFFAIDGSKLPYIDNRYDQYGANGSKFTTGDSYRIANVQIGIFLYRNCTLDNDGSTLARYQGGTLTMDNLLVSGNNVMNLSDATQDLVDGKVPLLKMSASYLGIVCRGGTVNLGNVTVNNTSIGIFTDGGVDGYTGNSEIAFNADKHAVVFNMDNCRVFDNWANDLYGYHLTQFNIKKSKFGATSGGAALAFDDIPVESGVSSLQIELNMDAYTSQHIINWVTGSEAWFVAYGHSNTATQLKGNLNNLVMYNTSEHQENLAATMRITESEKSEQMNFAIFAHSGGDFDTSRWYNNTAPETADAQGKPSLATNGTYDAVSEIVGVDNGGNPIIESFNKVTFGDGRMFCNYELGSLNDTMIVYMPMYSVLEDMTEYFK